VNKYVGIVSGQVLVIGSGGVVGAVVFIDDNNNGVFDPSESGAATDADGRFALIRPLNAGTATVRLRLPPGYRMDDDTSFRTISLPSGTHPMDFELQPFHIEPAEFLPFFDSFDRPVSTILGDDWFEVAGDLGIGAGGKLQGAASVNIALVNSLPAADVRLSALVGLSNPLNTGLVARYHESTGQMYRGVLVRRQGQAFAEIQLFKGGQVTVLASKQSIDGQGVLEFATIGDRLTLHLDGAVLIEITDSSLIQAGQFGAFLGPNGSLDDFFAEIGED
jgi:hypothetical protein